MAGPEQFGRLNIWAMLKAMLNQEVAIFVFNGTPVNGTSGTFVDKAGRGSLLIDYSTGIHYVNIGTKSSPNWTTETGLENITSPLTARAGGGQALATQLNVGINNVTVVATTADSVKLPLAVAGEQVTVRNNSANAMQVFGSGTDTINGIATAVGISQPANTVRIYNAITSAPGGNWLVDVVAVAGAAQFTLAPVIVQAGDGALNPDLDATYVITKASAAALTLAAPANPGSNGKTITVTSNTAFAHTITTATLLDTGTSLTTSVVFAAFAGASVQLMAYAGRWKKISSNAVTHT